MKLGETVAEALGVEPQENRVECSELNRISFERAMSVSTDKALQRYLI